MDSSERRRLAEDNRIAWNQAAERHFVAQAGKFRKLFQQPGYSCLDEVITAKLQEIGLSGKTVAQPSCNNGRETLSLINLGAGSGVGFDISDEFIAEAQVLAEIAKLPASFVRTDVYDIPDSYDRQFDLVFISIGTLGWLPDLQEFFGVAARLLKDGGDLVIYEMHPFLEVLDPENKLEPLKVVNHYFNEKPLSDEAGMDYYGKQQYQSHVSHWFAQSFMKIFGGLADNGLVIRTLTEYSHDISEVFAHLEEQPLKLPLCYILHAQRA